MPPVTDPDRTGQARDALARAAPEDRAWLHGQLVLAGALPPDPDPLAHPWTPEEGRCVYCDAAETDPRHRRPPAPTGFITTEKIRG